jgi:trans-aconitate methyltransferase
MADLSILFALYKLLHPAKYKTCFVFQPLASRLDIWETEYYHIMDSPQAIVN